MDKGKKKTHADRVPRSKEWNAALPCFCWVPRAHADSIKFFFFLLTQEGGADVPESRPAVSLFFLLLVCSQLLDVAKALPYSVPAFLFFLRVGLQQEGHLQASPKWEIVGQLPWRLLKSALLKRLLCCCCCRRLLWGMPDLLRGEECAGGPEEGGSTEDRGARGATFHSTSFRKFFSLLFFFFFLKCFNFCSTEQATDCSRIKPDRVFPYSSTAERHSPAQLPSSLPGLSFACLFLFLRA